MAFQLKAKESVSDGTRNVRREIEKALKHLGAKRKPRQRGAPEKKGRTRGPQVLQESAGRSPSGARGSRR